MTRRGERFGPRTNRWRKLTMSETNTDDLEQLKEKREAFESAGWESAVEDVDEKIDALDKEDDLVAQLVTWKNQVKEAENHGRGDDADVQKLREKIAEREERLGVGDDGDGDGDDEDAGGIEDVEEAVSMWAQRLEEYERVGWDKQAEDVRTELQEEGLGDTEAERIESKVEWLRRKADGEDAERIESLANNITSKARVESLGDASSFNSRTDRRDLAALAKKYDVDLSDLGDPEKGSVKE